MKKNQIKIRIKISGGTREKKTLLKYKKVGISGRCNSKYICMQ